MMIRPFDIPKQFSRLWTNDYVPDTRHEDAGWYARNSIAPCDCIPEYRLAGSGVSGKALVDLPSALEQSITNIKMRRADCEKLINQLTQFKETLDPND